MPTNTGKPSEKLWDDAFAKLGKFAFVFTFTDASKATGKNKRITIIDAQPSDRLLVIGGCTEFAEIKSTTDERNFCFKLLRKTQSSYAKQILIAGGKYNIYLHSLAYDQWYRIPYQVVQQVKDGSKASVSWEKLSPFKWSLPCIQM